MNLLDRISDRVGDFLEEVMLPEEIRTLHLRAEEAIEAGDYEEALTYLGEAEHRRPQTERTRRLRGLCHFHLGHTQKAATLFSEAIEIREEGRSHFHLGLCLEQMGRLEEAQTHLQRARTLDDDPPYGFELYFALGRVYLALDRPDRAARDLRRALRLWPDEPQATLTLAQALKERQRFEEAARRLDDLVGDDLDDADPDLLLELAHTHLQSGAPQRAVEAYEALLERHPDHLSALQGAATAHLQLHRPHRANQWLLRALDESEDNADIYALIGEANARIQNHDRARQSYQSALRRQPDHPRALLGLAELSLHDGDADDALEHYQRLIDLGDHAFEADALIGAARAHLLLDRPDDARRLLHRAADFDVQDRAAYLYTQGRLALFTADPADALVALRRARQQADARHLRQAIDQAIDDALNALTPTWSPPQSPDSTAELLGSLESLVDILRERPRLDAFRPDLHALIAELNQPLSVALVGEFNAGKSTLINALLSEEVVPMGVLPTTAHPCVMAYGPRKQARIHYSDGRLVDVDFADARRLMKDEAATIDRLHYTYPHPALRSINYWDTPGFNALDERHEALADQALSEAEAILWILDANQALKQSEWERLAAIADSDQRVLLVLNKIDRHGPPEQRGDAVDEIVDYLEASIGDQVLQIFPISAREALATRLSEEDGDDPNFSALQEQIDRDFVQRSSDLKIAEAMRQLRAILEAIADFRRHHTDAFDGHLQTLAKLRDHIRAQRKDGRTWAGESSARLADQLDFVALGVAREFDQVLRRQGRIRKKPVLDPDDEHFLLELFAHRIDAVLDRHRQAMLSELDRIDDAISRAVGPLLLTLEPTDARTIRRGLDALFDALRHQRSALHDRVFGPWLARAEGRIDVAGPRLLQSMTDDADHSSHGDRQARLLSLLPELTEHLTPALSVWYREYHDATETLLDRLHRDLETLSLDIRHRLDLPSMPPTDGDPER